MKNMKIVAVALFLFCICGLGVASAEIHIPAGTVSSYKLNVSGETYVLDGDVTSTTTAFTVGAPNITFDGNYYNVTYASASTGYGLTAINSSCSGVTVRNVNFVQSDINVVSSHGIYVEPLNNSNFYNCTSTTLNANGLHLRGWSDNTSFINCTFNSTGGGYGANIYKASNITLINCNCASNIGVNAVYLFMANYSKITDCTIFPYLNLNAANYNTINNTRITSTSTSCITLQNGTVNNTFDECTVINTGNGTVMSLSDARNNNFSNTSITGNTGYTVYLNGYSVVNNNFEACSVNSTTNYAIYSKNAYNTTMQNVTANSINQSAIIFENSVNNTLRNCVASTATSSMSPSAFRFQNSSSNYLYDCVGTGVYADGIRITINSNNNIFDNVTCSSGNQRGLWLNSSTGNVFNNMHISGALTSNDPSKYKLMTIGDSITEGGIDATVPIGAWSLVAYNVLNAENNSWIVVNQGVSGETSTGGRSRFTQEFNLFEPQLVTIAYGANDVDHSIAQQDTIDNILWMANYASEHGATPYILTVTPTSTIRNDERMWLSWNLTEQAESSGYTVINAYDAIDSIPENGEYDAFVQDYCVDIQHPNTAGNALLGPYVARNILATKNPYIGNSLNISIDSTGKITNSRDVHSTDTPINARFIPDTGSVNILVSQWSNTLKVWNESSETATSTRHVIGDLPANTLIQINRDGAAYEQVTSNETGYIDWTYDGGYSEHTFELFALIGDDFDTARHNAASTWSSSVALLVAIVIIIFSGLLLAAVRGTLSMPLLTNAVIGLMILTLVVLAGAGILSSFEGLI